MMTPIPSVAKSSITANELRHQITGYRASA